MPRSRRWASRQEPSASRRSMRSGREILRDAGVPVEPLADRPAVLAAVAPWADEAALLAPRHGHLAAQGRAGRRGPRTSRRTPTPGRSRGRSSTTRRRSRRAAALDFDDLILRAIEALEADAVLLAPVARAGAGSSSSTRSRTWTVPSSGSRCSWPRPPTGSSSWATTTSRSMAGGWPTCAGSSVWPSTCRVCDGSTSR